MSWVSRSSFIQTNMTVVSFIIYQGGTHSSFLCRLALDLWEWCLRGKSSFRQLTFREKTSLLRIFSQGENISHQIGFLKCSVFRKICLLSSPLPKIDLFISALNFQLPRYCSRCPVARVWRIDALSFPWANLRLYAFPPISGRIMPYPLFPSNCCAPARWHGKPET